MPELNQPISVVTIHIPVIVCGRHYRRCGESDEAACGASGWRTAPTLSTSLPKDPCVTNSIYVELCHAAQIGVGANKNSARTDVDPARPLAARIRSVNKSISSPAPSIPFSCA